MQSPSLPHTLAALFVLVAVCAAACGQPAEIDETSTAIADSNGTVATTDSEDTVATNDSNGTVATTDSEDTDATNDSEDTDATNDSNGTVATNDSNGTVATSDSGSISETIDPVLIGISVHVEGWEDEVTNEEMFRLHRDALLTLGTEVAAGGGVLTYELSDAFMAAVAAWDDDVLDQLQALGHSVAIHADIGGRGDTSPAGMTELLTDKKDTLAARGIETQHVSGICSKGPWIESALAAGFTSVSGGVAYCAASMDPDLLDPEDRWVLDCAGPAACHDAPPIDDDRRFHPFVADSSSDWMVSDASDGLLIISSESGHSLPCLDRSLAPEADRCIATDRDLEIATDTLEEYVDAREPSRTTALVYSWSIGNLPAEGFGTDLVDAFAPVVDAGEAVWVGVDEIIDWDGADVSLVAGDTTATSDSVLATVVSIHTHLDQDWQPYTDSTMTTLDLDLFDATVDLVAQTAALLGTHGVDANFQLSFGVAHAMCESASGRDLLTSLVEGGHEVGIHSHGDDDLELAFSALTDGCGVVPTSASGINFSIATGTDPGSGAHGWLLEVDALGITTVIAGLGLSDAPQSRACASYDGTVADAAANALLHSWLASPDDLCRADPAGSLAVITHSDRDTRALATVSTPLDNVDVEDFTIWERQLAAAVSSADDASTWGIVMALPAMMTDGAADATFLAAFDDFLGTLETELARGAIESFTASEAAARLR